MAGEGQEIRAARPDDAHALAELINFAGEGMPAYLWERMAEPGETPWDVGRRRARREEGGFSYRNATVVLIDEGIAACLIGYPQPPTPEPIDYNDTPPMFVPLMELENLAPASWYVNVLATYPEFRGRGLGSCLLAIAEGKARQSGLGALSLIVADANHGARRLYERCGYVATAEHEMVKEAWQNDSKHWVLMVRKLS